MKQKAAAIFMRLITPASRGSGSRRRRFDKRSPPFGKGRFIPKSPMTRARGGQELRARRESDKSREAGAVNQSAAHLFVINRECAPTDEFNREIQKIMTAR